MLVENMDNHQETSSKPKKLKTFTNNFYKQKAIKNQYSTQKKICNY